MKLSGQDHALDRRVRDVALVPERDVLERGHRVGADHARQPTICSQPIGIALVRHRDDPSARAERLLDFADLGLLQTADLERELLERARRMASAVTSSACRSR
jgi:hypothetical protein